MCKLCMLDAVLFAQQALIMPTFPNVIYLDGLVAFRSHAKLAGVVKIDRENVWLRPAFLNVVSLEELCRSEILDHLADLGGTGSIRPK